MRKLAVIGKELCADGAKCDRFLLKLEMTQRKFSLKENIENNVSQKIRMYCVVTVGRAKGASAAGRNL
jgi:hypothetical protein